MRKNAGQRPGSFTEPRFFFCKTPKNYHLKWIVMRFKLQNVKISEVHVWPMLSAPWMFPYFLPPSLAPLSSPKTVICLLNHTASVAMFKKPVILTVCHTVLTLNYIPPNMDSLAGTW